jgi:hypothetical protein
LGHIEAPQVKSLLRESWATIDSADPSTTEEPSSGEHDRGGVHLQLHDAYALGMYTNAKSIYRVIVDLLLPSRASVGATILGRSLFEDRSGS